MWNRGWVVFSSTTARTPARASSIPVVAPAGPPPMMITSWVEWDVTDFKSQI
jgi:hypothetical protein